MVNKYIIYVQIIPRRTPLRVKMSPPRAGTAVLQQTPETLSSYAFSIMRNGNLCRSVACRQRKCNCQSAHGVVCSPGVEIVSEICCKRSWI